MIGLVLVTHGRLAAEFITAMEHVVGPQQAVEGICIDADDDMESSSPATRTAVSTATTRGWPARTRTAARRRT
jgi:PTS system mannose-specific IIA component